MYAVTHIIVLYVRVSGFLRSYVTKTVPQTFICVEMSPFTCSSFTYLQQMRNCALHIGVFHSYSDLVIYLLKTQAVSEGTVMLKRSSPLSYARRPVNLNHNVDWLSIFVVCFTKGVVSMCTLTLLRTEISFLNRLLGSALSPISLQTPLLCRSNLTYTLAYVPHAYSYSCGMYARNIYFMATCICTHTGYIYS